MTTRNKRKAYAGVLISGSRPIIDGTNRNKIRKSASDDDTYNL